MRERILLFDDDYVSMEPFKQTLEGREFRVELTAAATTLARLATERFDLICVDFMIHLESPDQEDELVTNVYFAGTDWKVTGKEFLRRLRAGEFAGRNGQGTPADVPVIVISATADPHDNVDAAAIFEKPFDTDAILAAINRVL
jgi:CheY-like chemotaxis protein